MKIYKADLSKKYQNPIGLEFYTFYLGESNRRTKFNVDTGIFIVKPVKEKHNGVFMEYEYDVVKLFKKPKLFGQTIEYYINNFHACSANFLYLDYNSAVNDYNKQITAMIKNKRCGQDEIETLKKMLIKL